jgi:hypothetical protein
VRCFEVTMAARSTEKALASLRRKRQVEVEEAGDAGAPGRPGLKSKSMRGLRASSAIRFGSSIATPSKRRRNKLRKWPRAGSGAAPTSLIGNRRRRLKRCWLRAGRQRGSLHEAIEAAGQPRWRKSGADTSPGRSEKLRGRYHVRALRLRWRVAPAGRARPRYAAKRSGAAAANASTKSLELIDWTMREVRQLKQDHGGPVSRDSVSNPPAVIETVVEIISSPSQPIRQGEPNAITPTPATPPSPSPPRKGGRSMIAPANLEAAITEAVRKEVPGCEGFVGVIVQQTTPKSRFDANWALRGVKFGKADREKANAAIASIVERLQREYRLSND